MPTPTNLRSFSLTPTRLVLIVAAFLALTANGTFYGELMEIYPPEEGNLWFVFSLAMFHLCFLVVLSELFSLLVPTRIVVSLFILLAAAIGYFSDQLLVAIDSEMIRNIIETNVHEATDLINFGLLGRIFLFGIIPVAVIWFLPIHKAGWLRELRFKLQTIAVAIAVMLLCVLAQGSHYSSFFREHKPVRNYMNPGFAIYSAGVYISEEFIGLESHPYSTLAGRAELSEADQHRELIVLVVGETARADHFSLNGYQRQTNPELAAIDRLISYSDVSSCGTSTSISVPCMFSYQDRDEFDRRISNYTENILDLLKRAGVNILWRDNSTGSKGVASRVPYESYTSANTNPVCDDECRDVGMLSGLQDYVDTHPGDILFVLHQMGSHGPAYFKRYPQSFERFKPACKSIELSQCTRSEIINAYDNTILYTDYFLARVIGFLQSNSPAYETAMLYISDHGESLGEKGLFLHGIPYPFAPEEQTHIPVIIWSGQSSDIDFEPSFALKDEPASHDALFNTLLTLFEVQTDLPSDGKSLLIKLKDED